MFWFDVVGWVASAAVLATFCMNTMMPLRVLAIISNVLFCLFGASAHIYPVNPAFDPAARESDAINPDLAVGSTNAGCAR